MMTFILLRIFILELIQRWRKVEERSHKKHCLFDLKNPGHAAWYVMKYNYVASAPDLDGGGLGPSGGGGPHVQIQNV